jgi:lipoprotein-anchoring transpeptidase ErfK/SrfK
VVRFAPDEGSKTIGTIAQDTRVSPLGSAVGPGCLRWIAIAPRGWVCDRYLEPTHKPPAGVELPKLKEDEIVPGVFGKVVGAGARAYPAGFRGTSRRLAGSVTVRREGELSRGGVTYWKTSSGELVPAGRIVVHEPSRFVGLALDAPGALPLPFAWAQVAKNPEAKVPVFDVQSGGAAVGTLTPRTVVPVFEASPDGGRLRVGEGAWIATSHLRVAQKTDPPATTAEEEKWLDVDLDQQVVVAYEGRAPVYATLVSTGIAKWPTPPGVYRIWVKFAETDMNGQMGDEQPYSVATVPWTMFFAKDLAFHTAYWHDRFGERKSHGCVNLAPADARALYFWATPEVPLGWSMAHGIVESPGALVRIRSAAVPSPEFMGYARRVYDARLPLAVSPVPQIPATANSPH